MADIIWVTVGTIISIVFVIILIIIITVICCYKRSHLNPTKSKQDDSLQSMITNKYSRSNSSISFINNAYHNSTTLLASNRRFAILELQQQEEQNLNPSQTFAYENPSCDLNELTIDTKTMRF